MTQPNWSNPEENGPLKLKLDQCCYYCGTEQVNNRLLKFVLGDTLALFAVEVEETMPGTSMKHEVVGFVQNETELLQVV